MIPNIGPLEIAVVLIVALVIFGPKRLPELGSSLGKSIRGFGKGVKGEEDAAVALQPGESVDDPGGSPSAGPRTGSRSG
jgi:sec-independent protein translocase protein TatA